MRFWLNHFFSKNAPHKEAYQEVLIVCGLSLVPLLFLPLIAQLRSTSEITGNVLLQAISSGQLYLYSFSLLGTLHWLSQKDRADLSIFPPRKYFSLLVWLPAVVGFIVYSADPSLSKPLSPVLVCISIAIYVLSVALYYVLLVFEKLPPPDTEAHLEKETEKLINDLGQLEQKS
jgi:hypothetical protein